jgi:hypothetical protein
MKTFEYQIADYDGSMVHANFLKHTDGSINEMLEAAGNEGWELCCEIQTPKDHTIQFPRSLIFKRERTA